MHAREIKMAIILIADYANNLLLEEKRSRSHPEAHMLQAESIAKEKWHTCLLK